MNLNSIRDGMLVRVVKLDSTMGYCIEQQYLDNRKLGAEGKISGWVGGHGGDVWWVEHCSGEVAAYSYNEFEPAEANGSEPKTVPEAACKYVFSDDMGEITGFGGSYESNCRQMVVAGATWLDAHVNARPRFDSVMPGVIVPANEDAEELNAVLLAVAPTCSGAALNVAVNHILRIRKHGWQEYCRIMKAG